ncbi:MAG: prolyl oligopeptidase family serine peptidase [Flavobacteriaceae bacterium]|nr:prolyl oligopeptidase family serine peptidase [Flavobacteriaceae bacterium]
MKKSIFTTLSIFIFAHAFAQQKWNYPKTPKIPVYDTIWGKVIQDDYRWMENSKDTIFTKWLKEQADYTNNVLEKIPGIEKLQAEYMQAQDEGGKTYDPVVSGKSGVVFALNEPGSQSYKVYFYRYSTKNMELILDPEKLIPGKISELANIPFFSQNEKYLALPLTISETGKQTMEYKIWDVSTGKFVEADQSFSYFRFTDKDDEIIYDKSDPKSPVPQQFASSWLHKIGQSKDKDLMLLDHEKYPELLNLPGFTPGIFFLPKSNYVLAVKPLTQSIYWEAFIAPVTELRNERIHWKALTVRADEVPVYGIELAGDKAFFLSSKNEPGNAVRMTTLPNGDFSKSKLIFRPEVGWNVSSISRSQNYLLISTSKNGVESRIFAYQIASGKMKELKTGMKGNFSIVNVHPSSDKILFTIEAWNIQRGNYFEYDLNANKQVVGKFAANPANSIDHNLVVEQIEIASHDGEMVPVSIVYDKRYFKKDGRHRIEMTGYGAYGLSQRPGYLGTENPKLSRGFALVTAHVRGGGEKGGAWHKAAQKELKPNTWKDFIATAEYLLAQKYTSSDLLSITGGSAGGILIGRSVTERPDLFAVAIPKVGMMNIMRGEFSINPIGVLNEFGTIKKEDEAKWLFEMDAMHKVKAGVKYPAQLITAGNLDPRVAVWMPAKYAATMQDKNGGNSPQLLFVDFDSGHFGAATKEERARQDALILAFELWQTGHPDFQPKK